MLKLMNFLYRKKNLEERDVSLYQLAWDTKSIEGIDLSKLTEAEDAYLLETLRAYDVCITHLMKKSYRKFLHTGIIGDIKVLTLDEDIA